MDKGIWVIGDVHGSCETLEALVHKLPDDAQICMVGDLVDRGPNSSGVVDFVSTHDRIDCVLGNHEVFMIINGSDLYADKNWIDNGGRATILSYAGNLDRYHKHVQWMKTLPLFKTYDIPGDKALLVSHSFMHGIWKGLDVKLSDQEVGNTIWEHISRDGGITWRLPVFAEKYNDHDVFNIFGHSKFKDPLITESFAAIDTGAHDLYCGLGVLTAMHYPSMNIIQQENLDDVF